MKSKLKPFKEAPRLWVGTIHSVKGAEADVVYLWPDISYAATRDDPDAVRRVFYVGMTRAREKVVLCAPSRTDLTVQW